MINSRKLQYDGHRDRREKESVGTEIWVGNRRKWSLARPRRPGR